ncbi:hypothetical protein L218DRAFT_886358, partial [Marasmius fiardii PR-910]
EVSTYRVGLPTELTKHGIHNNFHVSLLRKHVPNDDFLFPNHTFAEPYNFGDPDNAKWLVDVIIGHHWNGQWVFFHVLWNLGNTTVEPYETCKKLAALDRYLKLKGVSDCRKLPRIDRSRTDLQEKAI